MGRKEDALDYHARGRKGKIEVVPTKPLVSQIDLSLAYTPGVAEPCLAIDAGRGQVVGVHGARQPRRRRSPTAPPCSASATSAPRAGKPVMEGKACLFKKFADIDVFDLEIDDDGRRQARRHRAPRSSRRSAASTSRTSRRPECFEIEERLRERMRIPVFHDDQHGTAIISRRGAAQRRASSRARSSPTRAAGRLAARAPARSRAPSFFVQPRREARERHARATRKGVIHTGRTRPQPYKQTLRGADDGRRTLADALRGRRHVPRRCPSRTPSSPRCSATWRERPIIFALANPDPGDQLPRGDRGAPRRDRRDRPQRLSRTRSTTSSASPTSSAARSTCRAPEINEAMKLAAARALAELAREHGARLRDHARTAARR